VPTNAIREYGAVRSRLGELLELLHSAHEHVTCGRVVYRDWTDALPASGLMIDADLEAGIRLRWRGAEPRTRPAETLRLMWFDHPDRLRVELMHADALARLLVQNGPQWWRWDRRDGLASGDANSRSNPAMVPPMLNPIVLSPARLISSLRLEAGGGGVRAGREVVLALGRPRRVSGDISYELEFDAEHGTLLRHAATADGRCFRITEATTIEYGCEVASERFIFNAPAQNADTVNRTGETP
jgi:hypothetical protein